MKYYEPLGEIKAKCEAWLADREVGFAAVRKSVRKYRGKSFVYRDDLSFDFAVVFTESPDPLIWKLAHRQTIGQFKPKATKSGKAILAEMDKVARLVPGRCEIGTIIGMEFFGPNMVCSSPGITLGQVEGVSRRSPDADYLLVDRRGRRRRD